MASTVVQCPLNDVINQNIMIVFKVNAFPTSSFTLFGISTNSKLYTISLGTDGTLYCYDTSDNSFFPTAQISNVSFWLNGISQRSNSCKIDKNWNSLVITFNDANTSSTASLNNYINIYSDSNINTNVAIISSHSLKSTKLDESVIYKYWKEYLGQHWYDYTSVTWKNVYGTFIDVSEITGASNIWDTFLQRHSVVQTDLMTTNDIIPLTLGKYSYETIASGLNKVYISQSPA